MHGQQNIKKKRLCCLLLSDWLVGCLVS